MHFYNVIAVEGETRAEALVSVQELLESCPTESDYYRVIKTAKLCLANGDVDPNVLRFIEEKIERKDREIARSMRPFVPYADEAEHVLGVLEPTPEIDEAMRLAWSDAIATGGKSISAHHNGETSSYFSSSFVLYSLGRLVKLLDSVFHNEVYFYDVAGRTPSISSMLERAKKNPSAQWIVEVDMHN